MLWLHHLLSGCRTAFFRRTTKRPAPPCTLPTWVSAFLLKFDIITSRLPKTNLYHEVCAQINYRLLSHSFGTTVILLATCTLQDSTHILSLLSFALVFLPRLPTLAGKKRLTNYPDFLAVILVFLYRHHLGCQNPSALLVIIRLFIIDSPYAATREQDPALILQVHQPSWGRCTRRRFLNVPTRNSSIFILLPLPLPYMLMLCYAYSGFPIMIVSL